MRYMLLYVVIASGPNAPSTHSGHLYFESEDICKAAAEVFKKETHWISGKYFYAWCFPEGVKR